MNVSSALELSFLRLINYVALGFCIKGYKAFSKEKHVPLQYMSIWEAGIV